MRKIRIVSIAGALSLAFLSTAPASAGTAGEGDAAEITACGADAAKYCDNEIMCSASRNIITKNRICSDDETSPTRGRKRKVSGHFFARHALWPRIRHAIEYS